MFWMAGLPKQCLHSKSDTQRPKTFWVTEGTPQVGFYVVRSVLRQNPMAEGGTLDADTVKCSRAGMDQTSVGHSCLQMTQTRRHVATTVE